MAKIMMGPQRGWESKFVLLIGADVDGKPNFMNAGGSGAGSEVPPMISICIRNIRYTLKGIRQNMTFSVNIPSVDLIKETDYCGLVSGSRVNKVEVCKFNVFYGKLGNAPLIEQCPVNLEYSVVHILNLGSHSVIIGRCEETHISESFLTDGKPDVNKIKPFISLGTIDRQYRALGEVIAKDHNIGQEIKAVAGYNYGGRNQPSAYR